MKLYIKFDINAVCKKILHEQLDKLNVSYSLSGFGEVEINEAFSIAKMKLLNEGLNSYGIEIVETQKGILIQKIKDLIIEFIYMDEVLFKSKISTYLSEKLNHSYGYLSNIFSDVTYTSIENFIILQKIERAKQLMITNELTFSEIAWKLKYSSVAHFSNQFKNITGFTPTKFLRIINKRRTNNKP